MSKPRFSSKYLATLFICLNRSGPKRIPPYQRVTMTITLTTFITSKRWRSLEPAWVSPSSSQSETKTPSSLYINELSQVNLIKNFGGFLCAKQTAVIDRRTYCESHYLSFYFFLRSEQLAIPGALQIFQLRVLEKYFFFRFLADHEIFQDNSLPFLQSMSHHFRCRLGNLLRLSIDLLYRQKILLNKYKYH